VVSQLDLMAVATPARRATAPRAVLALVLVVVALSAAARLVSLDVFPTLVFDEHYYVHDARAVVHGAIGPQRPSPWKPGDSLSLAHPPLGTLSIAAGIALLGDDPWGWRVPSALAGTLLIALVYPLARRLRLSPPWALAALVLAASDTMLIAESRIGVLDPFVALWSAVCIYCALRYVQSGRATRWLALCGLAGGLALASKWSGVLALLGAVAIVALDWVRAARAAGKSAGAQPTGGAGGPGRANGPGRGAALARGAVCLVAAPLLVYLASYADYFANGHTAGQWLHLQGYMASFNWNVSGTSNMASRPLTWIFDATPIWYRWELSPRGVLGLIAIGNPLLFWGAIAAFVWLASLAVRRRDPGLAMAPGLVAVLYLPWLATSRQSYIYYLTPAIPFLAILVAAALARLAGPRPLGRRWVALCVAVGAAAVSAAAGGTLVVRLAALAALAAFAGVVAARARAARQRDVAVGVGGAATTPGASAGSGTGAIVAWTYVGAVVGLALAWLPFVVSHTSSYAYYARLAWFTAWR
jgi:dolichyl-phosphate-mannose-protein mannosyltransferase